jgi:hypothetical protein
MVYDVLQQQAPPPQEQLPSSASSVWRTTTITSTSLPPPFPFWCGNFILHGCCSSWCGGSSSKNSIHHNHNNHHDDHHHEEHQDSYNNDRVDSATTTTGNLHDHDDAGHPNIVRMIHGLAIDVYARATIGMSSIFLGPALLSLANIAAGCDSINNNNNSDGNNDTNDVVECTNTVYGFRPSSLLTNIAAISGVMGCIALPLFGSIMDHTSLRKQIGAATGMGIVVMKMMEWMGLLFLGGGGEDNHPTNIWLYIAVLQIVSSVTFYVHLTAAYAYLSELTAQPSQQSYYNTSLFIIMYVSTLIFMIQVIVVSSYVDLGNNTTDSTNEDVRTACIALSVTVVTCLPCFYYSWTYLFPHRLATKSVPIGQNVYTAGFYTIYTTFLQLVPKLTTTTSKNNHRGHVHVHDMQLPYHPIDTRTSASIPKTAAVANATTTTNNTTSYPAIFHVLCSVAFSESAANAIIVVSTTYMKQVLRMNGNDSTWVVYFGPYVFCFSFLYIHTHSHETSLFFFGVVFFVIGWI